MKIRLAVVLVPSISLMLFAVTARCQYTAPAPTPTPTRTPYPASTDVPPPTNSMDAPRGKLTISLDSSIATELVLEAVPAHSGSGPWHAQQPAHDRYTLANYPNVSPAVIRVYSVDEYEEANSGVIPILADLRYILQDRPNLEHLVQERQSDLDMDLYDVLPLLPPFMPRQQFNNHISYLEFKNGLGVRFLTRLCPEYDAPITNEHLYYVFQGLTQDGRHLVSVMLPVNHPDLIGVEWSTTWPDNEADWQKWRQRLKDIERQLSTAESSSFIPSLSKLDAMVQSLQESGFDD